MSAEENGWVRRERLDAGKHSWCPGRPTEEHVLSYKDRHRAGDIWVCEQCKEVWVGVLRPSMLDAVPHWSIKWKRMCPWRAKRWVRKWGDTQP